ncbi:MAG: two-component system C4-dicarboxylate transport sensor histidine kinase DctB [Celeribacter sp.]|jgi:two-component system C4-dicarboxylate transport sensor histidine kinase DctB
MLGALLCKQEFLNCYLMSKTDALTNDLLMTQIDDLPAKARMRRLSEACGLLLVVAVIGLGVYALAFRAELDQAAARARADLALSTDRLRSGLGRYRELSVILAEHPTVLSLVLQNGASNHTMRELHSSAALLLQSMADKTGSHSLMLVSKSGQVLAASQDTQLPKGAQAAVDRAMNGALGVAHFVDTSGARRFTYAAPVFKPGGAAYGAVLVSVDMEAIEWSWPADPFAVYFTDADDVIFVSNRTELILAGGSAGAFPVARQRLISGYDVWSMVAGPYIPASVLHISQPLPVVDMTGELLYDLAPVRSIAGLQAGLAAAIAFAFGAFLVLATERRRTLSLANARLEARVAMRTADLEIANTDLMREVAERHDAEARLKRAQADLVQAGKLSALGEMSAGISHELNQPLMAIRSFSENAQLFLERGNVDKAGDNLGRIAELSRRMGRIIKNLRAFARQENEAVSDVDLSGVVDAALEMTMGKITGAGVTVNWTPVDFAQVRGGDVRLQQVVMNLVSNAVDAMSDCDIKQITITIDDTNPVRLSIADTGPGISDPEKMFEPFYTTKEVGAAQGMGLGLSISYGLIQSFGGHIRGANGADGGATFVIELPRARPRFGLEETP